MKKVEKKSENVKEWSPEMNPTKKYGMRCEYIMNGYVASPNYIQNGVNAPKLTAVGAGGYGAYRFQEMVKPQPFVKLGPHRHPMVEYFLFYSTNPERPDFAGGTTEFWLGEGDEAEPYLITKPTVVRIPSNGVHLPEIFRDFEYPGARSVIYEAPLWAIDDADVPVPAKVNLHKAPDVSQFSRKYANCINEQNLINAGVYPAHEGKAEVILNYDCRIDPEATKFIEATLVYGSDIGWGCGDMVNYRNYSIQSLPHIHDVVETYMFLGTNTEDFDDLGGEIEFWLGEGDDAEKIIINKPTVLLVPPHTVHMPMYVREQHNPFLIVSMLDTPLWSVYYKDVFPSAFEHKREPDLSDYPQFHLKYDSEKCIHCKLCEQQCQVDGIHIDAEPPVIGDPCVRCGQCALLCPTGAIEVELK